MLEFEGQIKKWGNSIALRMRKSLLEKGDLRLNQKVKVLLMPETGIKGRDLWGIARIKKSAKEIMKEIHNELDYDF